MVVHRVLSFDSGDFCKEVFFTLTVTVTFPLLVLLVDAHSNFLLQLELFRQLQLRLEGRPCAQLETFFLLPSETLRKDSFNFHDMSCNV